MPSPFPGMDPFLEHPGIFPDLHGRFITYFSEALQLCLPEPYFAVINERLWVENSERAIEPDTDILRLDSPGPPSQLATSDGTGVSDDEAQAGGVAVASPARSQPVVIIVPHEEWRQRLVEIRTKGDDFNERVVTTIELLSPANKTPGRKGRDLYIQKQQEVLDGDVNLVEIDLLRGGTHTTAVPKKRILKKAGPYNYHVAVHHFEKLEQFVVYPIQLAQQLPVIAVPLLPGDGTVDVDLQAVFNRCYDAGPYRRRLTYDPALIVPPLPPK